MRWAGGNYEMGGANITRGGLLAEAAEASDQGGTLLARGQVGDPRQPPGCSGGKDETLKKGRVCCVPLLQRPRDGWM